MKIMYEALNSPVNPDENVTPRESEVKVKVIHVMITDIPSKYMISMIQVFLLE